MKKALMILAAIAVMTAALAGCGVQKEEPLEVTADTVHLTKVQKYFDGDWYGWWAVYDPEGDDRFSDGDTWDACARISFDENGRASLAIWDEYTSLSDPICRLGLIINDDYTASSGEGTFMEAPIEKYQWYVTPQNYDEGEFFFVSGKYENEETSFDYEICLKKWGDTWEDVDEEDLPHNLETWYLPIVNAGGAMPEKINVKD